MQCPDLFKGGSKVSKLVANIDIAPTILEAAGLTAPADLDGQSFLPVAQGKPGTWRQTLLYEYYWERNFPQTPTVHALRGNRYKYIHYHGIWDIDELYDLGNRSLGKPEPDSQSRISAGRKRPQSPVVLKCCRKRTGCTSRSILTKETSRTCVAAAARNPPSFRRAHAGLTPVSEEGMRAREASSRTATFLVSPLSSPRGASFPHY